MTNVEEQYLAGVYTPDFLQHQDDKSGEASVEEVLDHCDERSDENDPSVANCPAVKRKAKGGD